MTDSGTEIREYKAADALELKDTSGIIQGNYWCEFEVDADSAELMGPGYTWLEDGEVMACFGIWIAREGVGEAWGLYSPKIKKMKLSLLKYTREYLEIMIKENKIRWLQATPKSDFPGGINFLQHLGFERKCRLEGYATDGSDCYLYSFKKR